MREKFELADRGQLGVYAVLNGYIKEVELAIFRKPKKELLVLNDEADEE